MTIPGMIRDRYERRKGQRCMLVKREGAYQEVTWDGFYGMVCSTALALARRGLAPGDRAAVLSHTRYEWAVADTAILTAGGVSVPLYPSLSRGEVARLLTRSGAKYLFVSDAEQVEKCLPLLDEVEGLGLVAVFEAPAAAQTNDPRVVSLQAFAAEGEPHDPALLAERLAHCGEDNLATVIFTSGTTGEPKGVMLTHKNILTNIDELLKAYAIDESDVCLSHLPLAHVFARTCDYYLMLQAGVTIAYAEDIKTVAQNIADVRPTLLVTVPRIFEKIYAGLQSKAVESPAPVRALTFWSLRVAREVGQLQASGRPLPWGLGLQRALADRLVYAKVRQRLGGRLRFFLSGGAPLAPELAMFFNAIGIQVREGYGLTETAPVIAANTPAHNKVGTVGRPLANLEVRIAEDGEILVRGPSVFSGYYQDDGATRDSFTDDGYFKTGDIGEIDADGFLKITDRKKDLIVTAGGKNVAPQKVENLLKLSKYISEVMLYGDKKNFVSALVVPDPDWLKRYAGWKKISYEAVSDLVRNPQVLDYYRRLIEEVQTKAGLAPYESVKKFVLMGHEFSAEQEEVTPTLKLRRKVITERYREQLEALYEEE